MNSAAPASVDFTASTSNGKPPQTTEDQAEPAPGFADKLRSAMPQESAGGEAQRAIAASDGPGAAKIPGRTRDHNTEQQRRELSPDSGRDKAGRVRHPHRNQTESKLEDLAGREPDSSRASEIKEKLPTEASIETQDRALAPREQSEQISSPMTVAPPGDSPNVAIDQSEAESRQTEIGAGASLPTNGAADQKTARADQQTVVSAQTRGNSGAPVQTVMPNGKSRAAAPNNSPLEPPSVATGHRHDGLSGTGKTKAADSLKQPLARKISPAAIEPTVNSAKSDAVAATKNDSPVLKQAMAIGASQIDAGAERLGVAARASAPNLPGKQAEQAWATSLPDIAAPLDPANVSEAFQGQLGERLVMAVRQDMTRAEIRITPEALGPISIELVIDGNTAAISFGAENANTRSALQDSLPSLREQLAREGLNLGEASVGEQPNRSSDHRDREQQLSHWTQLRSSTAGQTDEPALPEFYRPPTAPQGLVDLFA